MLNAKLVVVEGNPQGMQIPLQGEQFVIGRDPKCNLRPANDLVSKLHCAFLVDRDKLTLKDLNSTNGTFVNGERLQGSVTLKDGDLVKVATLVFAVKVEMPKAAAKPEALPAEDDDAMQWLLGDSSAPDGGPMEPSVGSTIMDLRVTGGLDHPTIEMIGKDSETVADMPAANLTRDGKEAAANEQKKSGDTREAAQAILNKYMVRRRT
jgi:pSer/pThr/pTyr-binding forkhead associated (FHA) protein